MVGEEQDWIVGRPMQRELISQVRRRPGMWFGTAGPRALRALVMEVVSNSIDLVLAGRADQIGVTVHADRSATIIDNGPGLGASTDEDPVTSARRAFTSFHDTPTADGHQPHVHLAVGSGLGPVCAVCERIEVRSITATEVGEVTFSRGGEVSSSLSRNEGEATGTTIRLWPDPEIFRPLRWNIGLLEKDLVNLGMLLPGLEVRFGIEPQSIGPNADLLPLFEEVRGTGELAHVRPVLISDDRDGNRVRLVMGWRGPDRDPEVRSFCNLRPTENGGCHVDGLREGLDRVFGGGPTEAMAGLTAVVHVLLLDPKFSGPTHDRLGSPEAVSLVADAIEAQLPAALDSDPDLQTLLASRERRHLP